MSCTALVLGVLQVPVSADPAQSTVKVGQELTRRRGDEEWQQLLEGIAAAYRSYHEAGVDPRWVQAREGARLRLIGRHGSGLRPGRRYVSVDLEDYQ